MPLTPYSPAQDVPSNITDTMDVYTSGVSLKNIFVILGDYWESYFKETFALKSLTTGFVELISDEYQRLLEFSQCSNITDSIVHSKTRNSLCLFSEEDAEITDEGYLRFHAEGLHSVLFLASSLFEPEVILEKDVHYRVGDGYIEFFVDIFNDERIIFEVYTTDEPESKKILLWAGETVFSEYFVFDRWGRHLYSKDVNSENYRAVVELIQYYFVTAKTVHTLEVLVNALMGLPFTRYYDEKILNITNDASHRTITTNKTTYSCHVGAHLLVWPGQEVPRHSLICKVLDVIDYVIDPYWFEGLSFFVNSIADTTLPDDVIEYLKYNTIFGHYFDSVSLKYGQGYSYGSGYVYGNSGSWTLEQVREAIASVKLTRNTPYPMSMFWDIMNDFLKYNLVYIKSRVSLEFFQAQRVSWPELYSIIQSGFPVYLEIYWDAQVDASVYDEVSTFSSKLFVNLDSGLLDQGILPGQDPFFVTELVGITESIVEPLQYGASGAFYSIGLRYSASVGTPFYDSFEYQFNSDGGDPEPEGTPLYFGTDIIYYGASALYEKVAPTPPVAVDDTGTTDATTTTSGNVLTNDSGGTLTVSAVNGISSNVGVTVAGSNGGEFVIAADGSWTFDPDGDFAALIGSATATTSVTYHASNGDAEASATLTVTVSAVADPLWTPAEIIGAQWFDIANGVGITYATSPNVTTIADAKGGSNYLTQPTTGKYPQLIASAYNGKSALRFDGIDDFINFSTAIPAGSHIFIVTKTLTYKDYGVILGRESVNGGFHSHVSGDYKFDANITRVYKNDQIISLPVWQSAIKLFADLAIVSCVLDVEVKWISTRETGTACRHCDICGIVVLPSTIATPGIREKIVGYYAHLLGLQASLHTSHPYRNNPPLTSDPEPIGHRYIRLTISKYRHDGVDGSAAGTSTRVSEFQVFDDHGNKYPVNALTSATAPVPHVVTRSSEASSTFAAWKAFDNVVSDTGLWISGDGGGEQWIQIDYGEPIDLASIKVAPDGAASIGYFPVDFRVEGSNTGAFSGEQTLLINVVGATTGWANNTLRTFTV